MTVNVLIIIVCSILHVQNARVADSIELSVFNGSGIPLVVGVNTPNSSGTKDELLPIPSASAVIGFQIKETSNDQYLVFYKAVEIGGKVLRKKPLQIVDLKKVSPFISVHRGKRAFVMWVPGNARIDKGTDRLETSVIGADVKASALQRKWVQHGGEIQDLSNR